MTDSDQTKSQYRVRRYNRNASDEDVLADLRSVANQLGYSSITTRTYERHGQYSTAMIKRRFGRFNAALELAGLQPGRKSEPTDKELFENLRETWDRLGRQPRVRDMRSEQSRFGEWIYRTRFGGWDSVLEAFIVHLENRRPVQLGPITESREEPVKRHKTKREIHLGLRYKVLRRDSFKCRRCGRSPATDTTVILHIDHIKSWADGGETVEENLQTLCEDCNLGKGRSSE